MSYYKNNLAEEAEKKVSAALEIYRAELARLFPEGSDWVCYHGSKVGYNVTIDHTIPPHDLPNARGWPPYEYGRGIRVRNTKTLAVKWVASFTLEEPHPHD